MNRKVLLPEILLLRPFTIFLLVVMHSFTVYKGSWPPFEGYISVPIYGWIAKIANSFMLELFVFISGFVMGFQIIEEKKEWKTKDFIAQKNHRLLIPAFFWGIFYYLLFDRNNFSVKSVFINILSGYGHLWFLPMLFWVFIFFIVLRKSKILTDINRLLLLFFLSIVSFHFSFLPFRLGSAIYYLFFFVLGYSIFKYHSSIDKILSMKHILFFFFIYVFIFIVYQVLFGNTTQNNELKQCVKICYSSFGVVWAYLSVRKWVRMNTDNEIVFSPSRFLLWINKMCFGIYIFQQFVLLYLYYHTRLPQIVGAYWLPWIGVTAAVFISLFMTFVISKNRLGRKLI